MNIQPLDDNIIIKRKEKEKETKCGLILAENTEIERPNIGTVMAVGPGKLSEAWKKRIPVDVSVGDTVLFPKYGFSEVEANDEKYIIVSNSDILAIIHE